MDLLDWISLIDDPVVARVKLRLAGDGLHSHELFATAGVGSGSTNFASFSGSSAGLSAARGQGCGAMQKECSSCQS